MVQNMSNDTVKTNERSAVPVKQGSQIKHSGAIKILQFLNGALVTGGGIAFAKFALTGLGTALGIIHLGLGIVGLFGAIFAARNLAGSKNLLVGINIVTIAYSAASEIAIYLGTMLATDAATDSLIGTVIAVFVSFSIIFLLWRAPSRKS
jgi:hypothetical protein